MRSADEKITIKDIFAFILFLALIAIPIYFAYTILLPRVKIFDTDQEEIEQDSDIIEEEENIELIEGPLYEEVFEEIEGEVAYIAIPRKLRGSKPSTIVVYSHGSNTRVTLDTEDDFMKDLQRYGEIFTKDNFVFAASNQHGENWGNADSIQDTINMVDWIKERYEVNEKIYMIGFSMGGLPTLNFATTYPDIVSKIALLAPTTRSNEWNMERIEKIKDMDIQIWHGTADVNVPYSLSTTFVSKLSSLGREIPLITSDGKTHWDMESDHMEDILNFFK